MTGPAVQAESGLSPLAAAKKGASLSPFRQGGEDRLLWVLVLVSAALHVLVVVASSATWTRSRPPMADEWVMDADLVSDLEIAAPAKTVLPDVQKAPEAKVPAEMLPQLPKQVSIKENTKPEEAVAEQKEVVKEPPPPPEEAKPAETVQKAEETLLKPENKQDNQIPPEELRKRRAMEWLREQQKLSKEKEAPPTDSKVAQVAENLFNDKNGRASGTPGTKGRLKNYIGLLGKVVHQHYNLPDVYNLKSSGLEVVFAMTLSEAGTLVNLELTKSSGDAIFDDLTKEAIKAAAPFPPPPAELVGEPIPVRFTP